MAKSRTFTQEQYSKLPCWNRQGKEKYTRHVTTKKVKCIVITSPDTPLIVVEVFQENKKYNDYYDRTKII